jgi:predicted DNA-binding WGR domain protein
MPKSLRRQIIRLAHTHKDMRPDLLGLLKEAGMSKIAEQAHLRELRGKLGWKHHANGTGSMLYFIDSTKNNSKFYEMVIVEDGGGFLLKKRWGRLTDSSGMAKAKDESFLDLYSAQMAMDKHKKGKVSKGYIDALSGQDKRHRTPDGRKVQKGEYPIGLDSAVGFGWQNQSVTQCSPALRQLNQAIFHGLEHIRNPTNESGASRDLLISDLEKAKNLISGFEDSSTANKVKTLIRVPLGRLRKDPKYLDDPEGVRIYKELKRIHNYVSKQLSNCG